MTKNNKITADLPDPESSEPYTDPRVAGQMLKYWRMLRGLTQKQLMERTNIPNIPYVSALETGRYHPGNSEHFPQLIEALTLSPEEIQKFNPNIIVQIKEGTSAADQDFTVFPVYDLAAASAPMEATAPITDMFIPVHRRDQRPGLRLYRVDGESMTTGPGEGILNGDVIAVDERDFRIVPERVYVVEIIGNGYTVKRARKLGSEVWLFSDNPDQKRYPPFRPDKANIKGRVYQVYRIPDVKL